MMGYGTGHDVGLMPVTEAMSALPPKADKQDKARLVRLVKSGHSHCNKKLLDHLVARASAEVRALY